MTSITRALALLGCMALFAGCATQVTEQPNPVAPATKRLGSFDRTVLIRAEISPPYDGQGANIKAVNKIDEILERDLAPAVNAMEVVSQDEVDALNVDNSNTLLIQPIVKQVKFISGGVRFFAGAFAGSSVVVMDVQFTDAATGDIVAEPGFFRKAGAYGDGFGIGDNRMLSDVATDVVNYVMANR